MPGWMIIAAGLFVAVLVVLAVIGIAGANETIRRGRSEFRRRP